MHWRRAARRGGKRACTGAAVACVVGFFLSLFCWVDYWEPSGRWLAEVADGYVGGTWITPKGVPFTGARGFQLRRRPASDALFFWRPVVMSGPTYRSVVVPLWLPFLLTAAPAAILWRSDRRAARLAARGACGRCGYDKSGLTPNTPCPECGTR